MNQCHETECTRPPDFDIEVRTQGDREDRVGFTVPACEEHVQEITEVIELICEETDVSVHIVPLGTSGYPPAVPAE